MKLMLFFRIREDKNVININSDKGFRSSEAFVDLPLHHVPYDVCFCEACTDEAQKVNEEPLNPSLVSQDKEVEDQAKFGKPKKGSGILLV